MYVLCQIGYGSGGDGSYVFETLGIFEPFWQEFSGQFYTITVITPIFNLMDWTHLTPLIPNNLDICPTAIVSAAAVVKPQRMGVLITHTTKPRKKNPISAWGGE